ncbi:MAG: thiamine diphosphokinase [Phototrophicales bacterium]|nr:MAG: thiamine diphosphokinase [Phototrophicales bacterium]RMG73039.1 MAG: thiamine diphosphokinase [Chloroflexota bacterium]
MSQALIFANGDIIDGEMVRRAIAQANQPLVIAADGGARLAQFYNLPIHLVIGDMDSLSSTEQANLEVQHIPLKRFPTEKDQTDLELALHYAIEQRIHWIRIIGGIGDRFDQTLANVYLMSLPDLQDVDIRMVAGKQEIRLVYPGKYQIDGAPGDTLSLIPISGDVQGIYTENLKYPLKHETLKFGPARGISNVMLTAQASIIFTTGMLLLVHTIGRA